MVGQRCAVRFVGDRPELDDALATFRLGACPHCHQTGWLIGHGWLHGYQEHGTATRVRGRRLFCSNRHRRRGCGRTVAVLLADVLHRCVVGAALLHRFVALVAAGRSRLFAWRSVLLGAVTWRHAYRLWHRVVSAHSQIATTLSALCTPPLSEGAHPFEQVLAHLATAGLGDISPFARLQLRTQLPLLG